MARAEGTSPRTQRLIALLATSLVGVATALAFGRVYAGHGSTWRLLGVAFGSALAAAALERRNLLLATLASAALMLVAIGLIVFRDTTWYGLPTLETLRQVGEASRLVGEQARLQVAPTPPLAPLMLAGVTAVWAAVYSSHALAFRAGSPLLALLPPVALVAFADTVLEEFVRPLYGLAFLTAALTVVFADALRRVRGWGPVWTGPGSRARLSATASRGARRVATAAVAVAAIVPILLPGFGSRAILDISSAPDDGRVRIDPLVSIKASLTRKVPVEVFEVRSSRASYWRMLALDEFDGGSWRPDLSAEGTPVTETTQLTPAGPAGSQMIEQDFHISSDLEFAWLPAAYPPQRIGAPDMDVRFDEASGATTSDGAIDAGTEYSVTSLVVQPSPEDLASENFPTPAQDTRYTQLPPDIPLEISDIARRWTDGLATDYERILAIQDRLRTFTYNADVPARDDSYTLVDFLTVTKEGFCQQFASSMAVMLRALGIPSRVAIGFTSGALDVDTGLFRVTTEEAHSWVEVLFPSYGWLAFEPTPTRSNPIAAIYADPESASCEQDPAGCNGGGPGGAGGPAGLVGVAGLDPRIARFEREVLPTGSRAGDLAGPGAPVEDARWRPPVRLVVAGLLALIVLTLIVVPPIRALGRLVRLRRAGRGPRELILATYDVFTDRAADIGMARAPGETLEEYRRRLDRSGLLSDGELGRLTILAGRAAYAAREPRSEEASAAHEAADATIRELRKQVGVGRRLAGIYRLRR
jgi:transglutaminase TgpA-like protein/transglutaminase superfamily protein